MKKTPPKQADQPALPMNSKMVRQAPREPEDGGTTVLTPALSSEAEHYP